MIEEIIYRERHEAILTVLVEMKKSLDRYKGKENVNEQWVATQERWLVTIGEYIKASKQAFEYLDRERSAAYQSGLEAGKEINAAPKFRQHFNPFDFHPHVVSKLQQKEFTRMQILLQQKTKWDDHYD